MQRLRIETAIVPLAGQEHNGTKEQVGDAIRSSVTPTEFTVVRRTVRIIGWHFAHELLGKHTRAWRRASTQTPPKRCNVMAGERIHDPPGGARFEWMARALNGNDVPLEVLGDGKQTTVFIVNINSGWDEWVDGKWRERPQLCKNLLPFVAFFGYASTLLCFQEYGSQSNCPYCRR